ncbi:MAG: acetoacetate decarboxylase family protein [Nitrospirae bacterium]|nr:acetoacetate decarboxylase family protein [Nitrospirota bacterium]MCL5421489.1 acetoacetate decarboxylase family protein [Nitrospirota bacterium]
MDENFFSEAKSEEVVLSSGVRIRLPIRYHDWSWINAFFSAPVTKVRRLLPSGKLKPILLAPGITMVALSGFEYRKSDLNPYNEFAVAIPVQYEPVVNIPGLPLLFHPALSPEWYRKLGMYVHHLPVTTQAALDTGVEIWGYPKFIAEISFEETGDMRRCRLRAEGKEIVVLEVKKSTTKARAISFYTYTVKNGQLLRTLIQTQGQYCITRFPGGASYTLGDHPIAEELKTLGMGRTALGRFYAPQLQSLLHPASERLPV